ncbi:MAG: ion transporter [Saprospiraceae bacterium]|nr:ion transporter [Saprospiraceae bacterium]MCB9322664.1 ion transporter [Lewinellaceae bacterium]
MFKRIFLEERKVLIAIVLNTIVIFTMYFPIFKGSQILEWVDHFFILFFTMEALVKIREYGRKNYFANGWNIFDFILVVGSLPSLLMLFFPLPDTSIVMILRIFRLVRIMRFIRFVPDVQKVVTGLGRAMKASVFVFVALLILDLLLAVITCHFYGEVVPEYFENPILSAYSIFQMFTIEGWNEIPLLISERLDNEILMGMTRAYFVMVVLTGGIFGMSLANAVFVDEMTMDNNAELENKIEALETKIDLLLEMSKEKNK